MGAAGPFDLPAGFRALVVGGAGGIGSAISRAFLAAGCEVVATGIDEAALAASDLATLAASEPTAPGTSGPAVRGTSEPAALGANGLPSPRGEPRLTLRTLDVTDDAAVASFTGELARVDVLVNCAGILARFKEFEIDTFRRVLDVNLTGTFRLCTACRPLLERSSGSIVNIASMNAFAALPFIPAYCASKGGVVMLTRSLALAWADQGIRVNAIAPGYVETPINAEGRRDRAHYERIAGRIALGRWAQPDDIAGSAVFLASPAARYITGTVLAVDGGFLAG